MKDYPKNKESLYNVAKVSSKEFCLDWRYFAMKKVMRRYFLKVDVEYLVQLRDLHNDLPFLLEIMRIDRVKKLKIKLMIKLYIRNLKQAF